MTSDVTTGQGGSAVDLPRHEPFRDLPSKLAAPTTHKRVGRSIKFPPGPSVDDGPDASTSSTGETAEDLGTAVLERLQPLLKTKKGYDDLGEALDGQFAEDRSSEEAEALERTVSRLFDHDLLDNPRLASRLGQVEPFDASAGADKAASTGETPELDTQLDTVLRFLADHIESVAAMSGVTVKRGGVFDWLLRVLRP